MFTHYLLSALVALSTTLSVSAHGTITLVNIDGTTYAGPQPATNGGPGKSIVRQLSDLGPVKGASNPDLACGLGAHSPAALVAPAKPGSTVELQWMGAAGPWIHEVGPMLTYMAQCTGTTCDKFDPKNAKWFKINEMGQKPDGTWYQADLKQGKSLTITLPSDLVAGEYLLRPELIALHNALSVGGAEMYPSCIQLRVEGGSAKSESPSNTVSFPGAYKDDSPSLVVPDIYNPGFKYTMPGPKLSNLVSSVIKTTAQLTGKDTGSAAAAANPGAGSSDAGAGAANAGASPSDAVSSSASASAASTKASSSSSIKPTSTTQTSAAATSTSKTSSSSSSSSAAAATHTKTCSSKRSRRSHKERMFAQDPAHFAKDKSSTAGSRRALGAHRQHRSRLAHSA